MTTSKPRRVPPAVADDNPPSPPRPPAADVNVLRRDDRPDYAGAVHDVFGDGAPGAGDDDVRQAEMLTGLARMRMRTVDPMEDYHRDGTRMLLFIQDAIDTLHTITRESKQQILRDALLGDRPLDQQLLDAAYLARYGRPRPKPRPERDDG